MLLKGKAVVSLVLLLAIFAVGCEKRDTQPALGGTSYVYLNVDLENKLTVVQLVEERKGNLASSQIMLYNNTSQSMTVYVRARYFDVTGREVPSTFGQWTPVVIERKASRPVSAVAPNQSVTRIMFEINTASKDPQPNPKSR